jgi:hypothetical protein
MTENETPKNEPGTEKIETEKPIRILGSKLC